MKAVIVESEICAETNQLVSVKLWISLADIIYWSGRVIRKREAQQQITGVARDFDISYIVVFRLWTAFQTSWICIWSNPGTDSTDYIGSTTANEDKCIVIAVKRNLPYHYCQVISLLPIAKNTQISRILQKFTTRSFMCPKICCMCTIYKVFHSNSLQWFHSTSLFLSLKGDCD